jgi:hypothetical protein
MKKLYKSTKVVIAFISLTKISLITLFLLSMRIFSQSSFDYQLSLVPISIPELPGLHSYAFAQHEGKWLLIGGRKDGLHARQPFNSFPESHSNTNIYLVDVANLQIWSSTINNLPTNLREQLQSTNMNFHQIGDTLYIIGGYGFSQTANDHKTYPFLTTINVSGLTDAIQNSRPLTPFFKQIENDVFAVTGGHLKKLNELFYLVGGHRFDGKYNPMNNPTFSQSYTNQIRKFSIDNSGDQLNFYNYSAITDPIHLRRRDYNLLPQVFPDRQHGFTISSGVFQIEEDLPFLYPVDIKENGYEPITDFNQYLSNYHSAVACLYDSTNNIMHSIFFGGMSQYYYTNGQLVQDDLVPFVKTISRLSRDANGNLKEYLIPLEMPGLKGSSAEFIYNPDLPHYSSKIIKLSEIDQNHFMIGHVLGGINSTALNPFASNQTQLTSADNSVYEVWLTATPSSITEIEIDGKNPYHIIVFPNPFKNEFTVEFETSSSSKLRYYLTNSDGHIVQTDQKMIATSGKHSLVIHDNSNNIGQFYLTMVFDNIHFVTNKLIKN